MLRIRVVALAAICTLAASRPGLAQDKPARIALAVAVIESLEMRQMFETQMAQFDQLQTRMMASMPAGATSPELEKQFAAQQAEVKELVRKEFAWDVMKTDIAQVYAATFSDDELKGLLAFYQSPLGRTLVTKTPYLQGKVMELMQQRLMAVMPRIKEIVDRQMEKMKKPGQD